MLIYLLVFIASSFFLLSLILLFLLQKYFNLLNYNKKILSSISNTLTEGVYILDKTGKISFVTQSAEEILGWDSQALIGQDGHNIFHNQTYSGKIYPIYSCPIHKVATTHQPFSSDREYFKHKDGYFIPVSIRANPLLENNKYIGTIVAFQDISLQKQTQFNLQISEQRLRTLINSSPDIICFKDGQGQWLEANQVVLKLFNLEHVDYKNKTNAELACYTHKIYENAFLNCDESDEKAWQSGQPSHSEEIIPSKKNFYKIYDIIKVPLFNADHSRQALIVLGRDITERKNIEFALQESEERYRQLVEHSPLAILVHSDYKIYYINQMGIKLLAGYTSQQFENTSILRFIPEEFRAAAKQSIIELYEQKIQSSVLEEKLLRLDGKIIDVELVATPIRFQNQKAAQVILHDITERKMAKQQLQSLNKQLEKLLEERNQQLNEIESRYYILIEHVQNYAIFMLDTEGYIISWNIGAKRIFGYQEPEVLGKHFNILFNAQAQQESLQTWQNYFADIQKKKNIQLEICHCRKNGEFFPVETNANYISYHNREYIIIIAHDITEEKKNLALQQNHQKLLEQEVASRTQELQLANKEIRNFAYIVSHDLRSPLVSIIGFSDEIYIDLQEVNNIVQKYEYSQQDSETLKLILEQQIPEAMEFIQSSVQQMDKLLKAILKLSRLGRKKLVIESVNTQTIVQEQINVLAHMVKKSKASIDIQYLPEIQCDQQALEQIFSNLLSNALKYLSPKRQGHIIIYSEQYEDYTVFHIEDNGCGIAEEDYSKIFQIFKRIGNQDAPGEGMGLTYVQALVRALGGKIWCHSIIDQGTTFSFSIPLEIVEGDNDID